MSLNTNSDSKKPYQVVSSRETNWMNEDKVVDFKPLQTQKFV